MSETGRVKINGLVSKQNLGNEFIPYAGADGIAYKVDIQDINNRIKATENKKGFFVLPSSFVWNTTNLSIYSDAVLEIRYNFDLLTLSVDLPLNLTLKLRGGSIVNGTLNGLKTVIDKEDDVIFSTTTVLTGSFDYDFLTPKNFGAIGGDNDDTLTVQKTFNSAKNVVINDTHICTPLTISSPTILELKPNSILKLKDASTSENSLITVSVNDVVIKGYGTLDGNSENVTQTNDKRHIVDFGSSDNCFIGGGLTLQNASGSFIRSKNSNDLVVDGIKFSNTKYIGIFVGDGDVQSNNITIKNCNMYITDTRHKHVAVKVNALADVGFYKNVTMENCFIDRSVESGTATSGGSSTVLTDSSKSYTVDEWVGWDLLNVTDNSYGIVTSNTSTTVTATLADGTNNDWGVNDVYELSNISQVGFETKYADSVILDNLRADNCSIGVSSVFGTTMCQVSDVIVNSRCPSGQGVELGSGGQTTISNPIVNGFNSLEDGILISNDVILSEDANNIVVSNCNVSGARNRGVNMTAVLTDSKQTVSKFTIQGGILQAKDRGIFIKNGVNVIINDLIIDCGSTPIVLEDTKVVSVSGITQINTINSNANATIVRLFSETSSYVFNNIKLNDININDGDGGDGNLIIQAVLSNGATLGANIMSTNNNIGYEVLGVTAGDTNFTSALVNVLKLPTPPTSKSYLNNVLDGSKSNTIPPAGSSNIGLWIKKLGVWVFVESPSEINQRTDTNLNDVSNAVNTTRKYAGKRIWNTTQVRSVEATGSTASSIWKFGDGNTSNTPV